MVRYFNITREGFKVGRRPTKRTLGRIDVPAFSLAINVYHYVFSHFLEKGYIYWEDGAWRLTNRGFNVMTGRNNNER